MVLIKFFSILAEKAGTREIKIPIQDGIKFLQILSKIFNQTDEELKKYICKEDGTLKSFITIVVNESVISQNEISNLKLSNKDVVAILTPIEGG